MPKLPRPTGKEMVRFLETQGFTVVRVRGSHHVLHRGRLRTTVLTALQQVLRSDVADRAVKPHRVVVLDAASHHTAHIFETNNFS